MRSGNERHIRKGDEAGLARSGVGACDAGSQRNRKWLTRTQPCDVETQRRKVHGQGGRTNCNLATERNRRKRVSRVLDERLAMQRSGQFVWQVEHCRAATSPHRKDGGEG